MFHRVLGLDALRSDELTLATAIADVVLCLHPEKQIEMILRLIFSTSQIYGKKLSVWQNVVGGAVRLGKIKCAAKELACVSACSSFNFAKG